MSQPTDQPTDHTTAPHPDDGTRLLGGFRRHVARMAPGAAPADVAALGTRLLARWQEPHRGYHDARHLGEVVAAAALLAEHARDLSAVVAAAWWHDAVYEVPATPGANEDASADLAVSDLSALGADPARVEQVARLVRLTATHDPEDGDDDGAVLCDADLAILASRPERYAEYAADVRREYAAVPDDAFAAGRAHVLRTLLDHDRLYRTPRGYELFEATARTNVAAEIARLTG